MNTVLVYINIYKKQFSQQKYTLLWKNIQYRICIGIILYIPV